MLSSGGVLLDIDRLGGGAGGAGEEGVQWHAGAGAAMQAWMHAWSTAQAQERESGVAGVIWMIGVWQRALWATQGGSLEVGSSRVWE